MILAPAGAKPGQYPTLGFDPAPGESVVVDATSTKVASVANDLFDLRDALKKVAVVDGIWEGIAAQAFISVAEPLPKQADEIAGALNKASGLLTGWEGSLDGFKRRAAGLEAEAAAAKRELEQARNDPALDLAGQYFPDEESLREAGARYDAAVQDVLIWEDRYQEIVERAKRVLEEHQDEAERIARLIDRIIEDTRGLLERLGEAVGEVLDALADSAEAVWDWVQDHAEFIKNVGDAFSALSTVLGLVGTAASIAGLAFPPLEAVALGFGIASAAFSGVAFGAHLTAKLAGAEDVRWSTIGFDAFGVASLGFSKAVTTGGKFAALGVGAFGTGAGIADSGGPGQIVDDLEKYWLPDDSDDVRTMFTPFVGPAGMAVRNAWEEAQR